MKNIKYIVALLIAFSFNFALSQSTTVSFTVVDQGGQVYSNGSVGYTIYPPNQYIWNGSALPSQYYSVQTVTLDSSGHGTFTVPSNGAITPIGSQWQIYICPDASSNCTTIQVPLNGTSIDISSTITSNLPALKVAGLATPKAYADAEILTKIGEGSIYYNTGTTNTGLRYWNGATWQAIGSGGSSGVPSVNSITGAVTIVGTGNTTVTTSSGTITVNSTGAAGNPAGPTNGIQVNNGGVFGAYSSFTYNPLSNQSSSSPQPWLNETLSDGTAYYINQTSIMPGFSFGNAPYGPQGWYGSNLIKGDIVSYSQQIYNIYGMNLIKGGDGDINLNDNYWEMEGGQTASSDEGGTGQHNYPYIALRSYTASVSAGLGGQGQTFLSLYGPAGYFGYGLGRILVDKTDDPISTTITGTCSSVTIPYGSYLNCPVAATVPVGLTASLASNILGPSGNNTFTPISQTFTVNTTTALCAGDFISLADLYYDQTKITSVGALSGGTQSITAPLYYSHVSGGAIFVNHKVGCSGSAVGMTGRALEQTSATSTTGVKQFFYVLGSIDANHIAVATKVQQGMDGEYCCSNSVNIYHGAPIMDGRNLGTNPTVVDGTHATLMPNDALWADNASVEQPPAEHQIWAGMKIQPVVKNPYSYGNYIALNCPINEACAGSFDANPSETAIIGFSNANTPTIYSTNGWHVAPFIYAAGYLDSLFYYDSGGYSGIGFRLKNTTGGFDLYSADDQSSYIQINKGPNKLTITSDLPIIKANNGIVQLQGQPQIVAGGSYPQCGVGPALGTGTPSCSMSANYNTGTITITTGTSPTANALATTTIPFGVGSVAASCSLTPQNALTAALNGDIFIPAISGGNWSIAVGATPLAASTTYTWTYQCL